MDISLVNILDLISKGGLAVALVVILIAGMKGYWVWGWIYKEGIEREKQLREERNEWRDLAIHGMNLADKGVNLVGEITNVTQQRGQ